MKGAISASSDQRFHIGFSKEANPDVTATLQIAVDRINSAAAHRTFCCTRVIFRSCRNRPSLIRRTSTQGQGWKDLLRSGEHDVLTDDGSSTWTASAKARKEKGWYSFDHKGAHFIGWSTWWTSRQVAWDHWGPTSSNAQDDVKQLKSSTPVSCLRIFLFGRVSEWGGAPMTASSTGILEALPARCPSERPHSPDHAKGGGQRHIPHGESTIASECCLEPKLRGEMTQELRNLDLRIYGQATVRVPGAGFEERAVEQRPCGM